MLNINYPNKGTASPSHKQRLHFQASTNARDNLKLDSQLAKEALALVVLEYDVPNEKSSCTLKHVHNLHAGYLPLMVNKLEY